MAIAPALVVPTPKDPVVLSYKALRKAVGIVAIALPFVVGIPYLIRHHVVLGSISAYYYTGSRNLFVGLLCAISMFMFCNRGYDKQDDRAGVFSALCAVGVALCPMDPTDLSFMNPCIKLPWYPPLHFIFATSLFLTLGYFCLFLFRLTSGAPTLQKVQRNRIYAICGWLIYASIFIEGLLGLIQVFVPSMQAWWKYGHHLLICEVICLWAFGYAWLVKGETFLKDSSPDLTPTRTTDNLMPQ